MSLLGSTVSTVDISTTADLTAAIAAVPSAPSLAIYEHHETNGTAGGTFTSGSDQQAIINQEVSDPDNLGSLSANRIMLSAAGTYRVRAWTLGYSCGNMRAWLYDFSNSVIKVDGSSAFAITGGLTVSFIEGVFTQVGTNKVYEIRKRCSSTQATDGYGKASSFGTNAEVYTRVLLEKVG